MNEGYVRVYRSFLQMRELKHSDKMVFLGLWSFADRKGICWPSQKTLGKAAAVSPRQVRTSLNNLTEMGLVMTERRGAGRASSRRYRLAPLEKAALIVAGKKALEEKKARCLEVLEETTTGKTSSSEDKNALVGLTRSNRKKLPEPPENRGPAEGMRKILPPSASCGKAISENFDRRAPGKTPAGIKAGSGGGEKRHFRPIGTAVSAGSTAIPAYRTRTIELKPEKKNQVLRPWERYLKPQPSRGETAGTLSP